MALRLPWEDERYVRIYCRDTIDWQALSWDAQALYVQLCRKATRKGRIDLGRAGRRGVAALVGRPEMVTEMLAALSELEADGCVLADGAALVLVDFEQAQEAISSNAARQRRFRERQRDEQSEAQDEEQAGRNVTLRPATEALRPYSTAQHSTEGTVRLAGHDAAPEPPAALLPVPALTGEALSRSFAAELEAEGSAPPALAKPPPAMRSPPSPRAKRQDPDAVLGAIGSVWRTVGDLASALRRKVDDVETDLLELRKRGVVERAEQGSPPIMHWRRKQHAPVTAEGMAAEAAG